VLEPEKGGWLGGHPRHWSTDEVDPGRAFAYWVDTVCDRFLELDIDTPQRDQFRARLDQVDFGASTLNFLSAQPQRVRRTQARIARTRHAAYFFMQLRTGRMRLRHLGREAHLRVGECVLIDTTEPYDLECPQATTAAVIHMPGEWLHQWLPRPETALGVPFARGDWSAALCAAMGSLHLGSLSRLALPQPAVAEHIAALLVLAVGRGAAGGEEPGNLSSLFRDLMDTLRENCGEPGLSPMTVAARHGISRRTLHYAFAGAHTTFVEELMHLRLARARELLGDAQLSELAIEDVATRCGFSDPGHFARRFRQHFGQAPLQFRRAAIRARH
jgi:AraC family transcriptional regulator, positive regulator of tynA and feaB